MFKKILASALFLGLIAGFTSCNKTKDSIAKITVHDSAEAPVANATVTVRPESSNGTPESEWVWESKEASTDAVGVATFNFNAEFREGTAGLMVLTIDVEKNGVKFESAGIIKVEEEVTTEQTVQVNL